MRETYFNYFPNVFDNTFGTEIFRKEIKDLVRNGRSLTDSKQVLDEHLATQSLSDTRVIVEYEENREKNREIKAIYVRGFEIPWEKTNWFVHETAYLKNLPCDLLNPEKLRLTESPFQYLNKIPDDLRFLLFIDLRLFDFCLESWPHYDDREPGCVANYFQTLAEKVCKYLATPAEQRGPLTLAFILELHDALTKNLNKFNSGKLRNSYNACPMNVTNTSKEGIKELLLRIKNDKNKDSFRIGKLPKFSSISAVFASQMRYAMIKKQIDLGVDVFAILNFTEEFPKFKQTAIEETRKSFQKYYSDVPIEIIQKIIQNFLDEYKASIDQKVDKEKKTCNWFLLMEFFYSYSKRQIDSLVIERDYKMLYARQHACAHVGGENSATDIGQYSEEELDRLAQTILEEINQGANMYILPPSHELMKPLAETAVANFNNAIQKATNAEEIIVAVDALTHELEILHIFIDGNCRTNYVLQNLLLMANNVKWSVLYDPLRIGTYSKDERIKEIKQGIFSYEFIINNKETLLEKNQKVQAYYQNANVNKVLLAPEQQEKKKNDPDYCKKIFDETLEKYCALERGKIYQQARSKVSQATIPEMESIAMSEQALQSSKLGNNNP